MRLPFWTFHAAVWLSLPSSSRAASPQKDGKRSDQMDERQEPRIGHADRQGLELQQLTNAMVRLYKELFGLGPTKARTNYSITAGTRRQGRLLVVP
jgi:hypothetical protein